MDLHFLIRNEEIEFSSQTIKTIELSPFHLCLGYSHKIISRNENQFDIDILLKSSKKNFKKI